jgi:hypothetical protein
MNIPQSWLLFDWQIYMMPAYKLNFPTITVNRKIRKTKNPAADGPGFAGI